MENVLLQTREKGAGAGAGNTDLYQLRLLNDKIFLHYRSRPSDGRRLLHARTQCIMLKFSASLIYRKERCSLLMAVIHSSCAPAINCVQGNWFP